MMSARRQTGLSLIELMIALTIGLLLMAGLTYVFVNASKSQRVGQDAAQQNDNARYAMDTLTTDLHLAGYYGQYAAYGTGGSMQDPCATSGFNAATLTFPVQAFIAQIAGSQAVVPTSSTAGAYPSLTGTTCGTSLLPQANLMPGSDILVIRRVDSTPLGTPANPPAGTSVTNLVYLQTNPLGAVFETGNGSTMTNTSAADGTTSTLTEYNQATGGTTAGPINQYYVDIYFVAPCSVPASGTACTGASGEDRIPTLKMLQLGLSGGTLGFTTYTIAEGIQAMKLEFGIDNIPTTANTLTNHIGDGQVDCFEPNNNTTAPALTDYPNAVTVKVFLISRNTTQVSNFTDSKYYPVSSPTSFVFTNCATSSTGAALSYGPYSDSYMRHAYASEIRLTNLAGRREIP